MTEPAPQPDMAWCLRRLLEAVKEAARGLERRWRWLTGPLVLLTWLRTRRERREAAEAMQAVQGLLEAFLGLLEDFRAGRLVAESGPEVAEAGKAEARPWAERQPTDLSGKTSDAGPATQWIPAGATPARE